jgi:hypothetical protein
MLVEINLEIQATAMLRSFALLSIIGGRLQELTKLSGLSFKSTE